MRNVPKTNNIPQPTLRGIGRYRHAAEVATEQAALSADYPGRFGLFATLSMLEVGKVDLQNAVIKLRNPRMQGKDLVERLRQRRAQP